MQIRFKPLLLPLASLMLTGSLALTASAQQPAAPSVAGELLVRWKSQRAPLVLALGTNPSRWQQSALRSQLSAKLPGANLKKVFATSGWSLVKIPAGQSTEAARAELVKSLGAANVSLNFYRYASRTPNDPYYPVQWQWPKIKAPDAWDVSTNARNVVVAVMDSGVDLNHPDIKANLWVNIKEIAANGIDDDGNGYVDDVHGLNAMDPSSPPQDDDGHGTHCAGLVGGVGNNAISVTGASWSVQIMALKFLGPNGGTDDDAISCLEYAISMKKSGVNLRVISNSYGSPADNPAFKDAYQAAETAGILNVSAAGNESRDNDVTPLYPSSYSSDTNISVAASDKDDAPGTFSNYGARGVDLAAPGVDIDSLEIGGGVVKQSGTSMATPIVAGAAALISSLEPTLSAKAIKARLMSTVDKIAGWENLTVSGGRLNMARAVLPISYELKGQVSRSEGRTRIPLASATVTLSGTRSATATTDSNGNYTFGNLAPGTYNLQVRLSGYTFTPATRNFPADGLVSVVNFRATSAPTTVYTLFGTARDEAGAPQAGVSIALNTAPNTPLAVTDSAGRYTINNRPRGIYTLKATSANFKWKTIPNSVSIPDQAVNGRAEINFTGVLLDKSAPAITITAPADGSTFAPGNQIARGLATDASGNKEIYLQLTRFVNLVPSYYSWTTRQWISERTDSTILTRTATGKNAKWEATLPYMTPASYSLRVSGRDVRNNISTGEADAFTSFNVVKSASNARTSAGES